MHPIIQKTFGGLSAQYYFRQLFFSLLIAILFYVMSTLGNKTMPIEMWLFAAICSLLYPYSRFVYESIVGFIMGNNVFFVNALSMLISKAVTMLMCWLFAALIAPFGLIYLYIHHSKATPE